MTARDPARAPSRGIPCGGLVDPLSQIYVERQIRDDLTLEDQLTELLKSGRDVTIIGTRHVGKSSVANFVGRRLEEDEGWAYLRVDLDGLFNSDQTDLVTPLLWSIGVRDAEPGGSIVELVAETIDEDRPTLLVIDELDRLVDRGIDGGAVVRLLRSLQQGRATHPTLRQLRLCLCSVRDAVSMFDDLDQVSRVEAARELNTHPLPIGHFPITDNTRAQLEECFVDHDPANAGNLARWALDASGGYPQLCMMLADQLIRQGVTYQERESFLPQVVELFRDPLNVPAAFLRVVEQLVKNLAPQHTGPALSLYRDALGREEDFIQSGDAQDLMRWENSGPFGVLSMAGLIKVTTEHDVVGPGLVRTSGPFMERFFDRRWIERLQESSRSSAPRRTNLPRVAVIVTGGTIGMVEKSGKVRPADSNEELQREYDILLDFFDVEWIQPGTPRDSANVSPDDWRRFAIEIDRVLGDDFAGVVVAHGTDTLAYTASAVAYALGPNLAKPVVFTGSQTTVDQVHGDARTNLFRACLVATRADLREVVVLFGEHVHRAVRAVKRDDRGYDAFESFLVPPIGTVGEEVILDTTVNRSSGPRVKLEAKFENRLLVIQQVPGIHVDFYRRSLAELASDRPSGIIVQTLGAGNVPTQPPYDLSSVIQEARGMGIPVLMSSMYPVHTGNLGRYTPSEAAIAAGAVAITNMTAAATFAKFSWVLGKLGPGAAQADIRAEMLYPYVDEISEADASALGSL
ncbi:MAG: asparaginase domain-containing protein [Actinomycetota bacterium]